MKPGGKREQIISDFMDQGYGYKKKTAKNFNKHLQRKKKVQLGVSFVQDSYLILQPAIILICKVFQGTYET